MAIRRTARAAASPKLGVWRNGYARPGNLKRLHRSLESRRRVAHRAKETDAMKAPTAPERHDHGHAPNHLAIIPTPLRLAGDVTRTGRGVTIAFIDSGFYPHPDLTQPVNRIVAYEDLTQPGATLETTVPPPD